MSERGHGPRCIAFRARAGRKVLAVLAAGALFALVLALWTARERREQAAVMSLPAFERRALYERTLHTLESTCETVTHRDGLADLCGEQAEFILQFPECDAACAALAQQHRRIPSR